MVVDRRALGEGGRELSWFSGAVLDAAVPIQKMVSVPVDLAFAAAGTTTWRSSTCARTTRALRGRLARLEEENLQLREALVASGRLQRIAEMRDEFEIPMLPAELVGVDVSAWFRSVLAGPRPRPRRARGHAGDLRGAGWWGS